MFSDLVLITADLDSFLSYKGKTYLQNNIIAFSTVQCSIVQYSTIRSECGRLYIQVDIEKHQQQLSLMSDHTSNERIKESRLCTAI